jgi:EmrB/QacA subfamily drug resistance transporter
MPAKRNGSRASILATTILASGSGFLMGSAVNIALPTIQRALDVDIAIVQWIANAYALALSGLILLSGSLGDIFGTRRVYNTGILVFTLGALASGLAPGAELLIAARGFQGIGAALMIPGSLAIINETFPRGERGKAIGLWAGVSGAIAALGPFVGGFLVQFSWRYVFFAMVPLGAVTLVLSVISVPELHDTSRRRIDWIGALLILVGLTGLSFGLIRLPEAERLAAPITAIVIGVSSLAAFVLVERSREQPLVPFSIFTPLVAGANAATLLLYFAFQGTLFLLSFYMQQLLGYTSINAGLALLPATMIITVLSAPSGTVTDRRGPRLQMIAGPVLVACGLCYLVLFGGEDGRYPADLLPGIGLLGLGMVTLIPAVTKSALEVRRELSGTASGVNNAAARLAGLLAVTVVGSVLNAVFRSTLNMRLPRALPTEVRETIIARSGRLLNLELPEQLSGETAAAVQAAMSSSFAAAFRAGIAVAAAAALLAAVVGLTLIRNPSPEE